MTLHVAEYPPVEWTTNAPGNSHLQMDHAGDKGKKSFWMKKAHLLHNPEAGEGETSRRQLIRQVESAGFKCSYSSTKPFSWENIETDEVDFLILAGGDGTVRKIADELLSRKVIEKNLPIGLLPMGTANNIARTLGLCDDPEKIIAGWRSGKIKKFDVGNINGLEQPAFFLESFGYGLFPKLMREMKKQNKNDIQDPKEKLLAALQLLEKLIAESPVKKCKLRINEEDCSGEFILLEVMNTRSIGPNLNLAPEADPGDGEFDVVLIREEQRAVLAEYVQQKIDGREVLFDFPTVRAKALEISWDGKHMHVDDEYYRLDKPLVTKIEIREGLLQFLLPIAD